MRERGVGAPPDDRFKYAYDLVANHPFETMVPPDYRILKGVVDPHMHVGARRIDPLAQVKLASRAGMRAIMFKNSQNHTIDLAHTVSEVVAEWAEQAGIEPAQAVGGVVLGTFTGGINLDVVRWAIKIGGRAVWLPVLTSAQHLEVALNVPRAEARQKGVYILEGGRLLPQVAELVKIVQDADVALSLGHLSPDEMKAVAEVIHKVGYKKGFVDHPFDPPLGLTEQDVYDLADAGLHINWTYFEISQFVGVDPRDLALVTRKVGPDKVMLSSDACFSVFPDSVEAMRILVTTMSMFGFSEAEMAAMKALNSCRLLGLEPRSL